MKRWLLSLSAVLVVPVLLAFFSPAWAGPPLQSKEIRRTVDLEAGGDLTMKIDMGRVRLVSWDRNQVELVATVEAPEGGSADYARRAVEAAEVDVYGGGRSLTIRSNYDNIPYREDHGNYNSRSLPPIRYEIRAPRRLNLYLEVDRSTVELQGLEGKLDLQTDRSPIKAADLAGTIRLRMDRGGSTTLTGLRGSLDVEADRTDIELHAAQITGDSRLETHRGQIDLRLPESQGLTIDADIDRRGGLSSDFELSMTISGRVKFGESFNGRFEGPLNGGGPRLSIRAHRGEIRLKRQ